MNQPIRTIVTGVASVHEPDAVLASAIAIAEAAGARLHFVHAYELPDPILSAYAREGLLGSGFGARYRDGLQAQLEAHVRSLTESDRVHCHAVAGPASDVLCDEAERLGAELLIVGATRAGKFLRVILGSTAERVIRGAHLPVLVLRRPFERPVKRVLLTTDLSELSAAVHERGISLADGLFAGDAPELRSLLVVWYDLAFPPPLRRDTFDDIARAELEQFLAALPAGGDRIETRVRIGDPAKEITAEVADWQPDLLVLGTHGRARRSRSLLGSVAEGTVRSTTVNVLVIPPISGDEGPAARAAGLDAANAAA